MSVVSRAARRRWAAVIGGVVALCLVPVVLTVWPAPEVRSDPQRLRSMILASAGRPYQGFAESDGSVGLPELPGLADVSALLSTDTRMRTWYAGPQAWRVAVVDLTGERDIYQTTDGKYVWDFERNLVTQMADVPVRLPWAADVTPPDLARRLLRGAATRDRISGIGSRRVAGVVAAGLRISPVDPDTTVGRVDIWADPATGLPLRIEIAGHGGRSVLVSRFLEVSQRMPSRDVLLPALPATADVAITSYSQIAAAINAVAPGALPPSLAGRPLGATPTSITGVRSYGTGWSGFVVLRLPGRIGQRFADAVRAAGGVSSQLGNAEVLEINTSLLSTLIVRWTAAGRRTRTYLLAGLVSPSLLRQAGTELVAAAP